jgi:hypothetical protein
MKEKNKNSTSLIRIIVAGLTIIMSLMLATGFGLFIIVGLKNELVDMWVIGIVGEIICVILIILGYKSL